MSLLIYTPNPTIRCKYTFDLIVQQLLGLSYTFTSNIEQFKKHSGAKFTYAKERIDDGIYFYAHNILFEEDTKPQRVEKVEFENCIGVFPNEGQADMNFDPFASAFYLVTRYEEYLPHHVDQYKRFGASNSIAYHFRFLRVPMVNYYVEAIQNILEKRYPTLEFAKHKFQFLPTYDIDNAYEYSGRGIINNTLSAAKKIITFKWTKFIQQCSVLFTGLKDPYDTYSQLDRWHKKFNLYPIYFFLTNRKKTAYDNNISCKKEMFKNLVGDISKKYEAGIHPSYYSNSNLESLKKELDILNRYTEVKVTKSRQHFLKVKLPETYQNLIALGIQEDYTMGYSSRPGFRASICHPFYWFDLSKNEVTNLKIVPFAFMDATFKYYKFYKSEKIRERLFDLYHETKRFGGVFVTVMHNDILSEDRWRKIYEGFLTETYQ